jgi:hypothetical protein
VGSSYHDYGGGGFCSRATITMLFLLKGEVSICGKESLSNIINCF